MSVELSHSALACVLLDNLYERFFVELQVFVFLVNESRFSLVALYEMSLSNLILLFCGIACKFNKFHTVEERAGESAEVVCRTYEEHIREVEVDVEVVVVECGVLLWVENFKECRCWVAMNG